MRFTASLANIVMKVWDIAFRELLQREGIIVKLYLRYVDDCRPFLNAINRGWVWNGSRLVFSEEEYRKAEEPGETELTWTTT